MTLHQMKYVRIGLLVLPGFCFSAFGLLDATVAARKHAVHAVGRAEPTSVIIVADGSTGWQAGTVNEMIQTFIAEFGSDVRLQVVRFDAEPNQQAPGNAGGSIEPSSLNLPPRTSMRDAIMAVLSETQALLRRTRAIVVIVSEEFYGSSISRRRLVGTARQWEVPIYSILLTRPADRPRSSFIKSFGRALAPISPPGSWKA